MKSASFILAIGMFVCLADMPYGYFQLIRTIATIFFVIAAAEEFNKNKVQTGYIFIGLAILFQPLFKIALGRDFWNIVDVLVGIWLVIYGFQRK